MTITFIIESTTNNSQSNGVSECNVYTKNVYCQSLLKILSKLIMLVCYSCFFTCNAANFYSGGSQILKKAVSSSYEKFFNKSNYISVKQPL